MMIAQICPRYCPYMGGVETHVKEVSERLVERGFKIEVLTTDPSGKLAREEIINGVRVKRFKSWAPGESYYFSRDFRKYLMKNSDSFDIVHTHSYHAFPSLYSAQAKSKNMLVFTPHYHGTGHTFFRKLLHIPYKFLGKKIFEKADKIVCVSNYERNLVMKRFKVEKKKVVVIPNGISLEEFRSLKKRNKDYRAILYVGRLEKYKGVQYLVEALPKISQDAILEIIGKGSYKKSLIKLARKLNIDDRVRFSQDLPRNELLQKYVDANVFVLLSEHEAYGISVAEALCAGTPCIVTKASALGEWIDDENCFGIEFPINLNELANLITYVIGKDVKVSKVSKISDWNETVEKLVRLYERC
jgi:glycosyltransferase involved in cell wall biosynthesis